MSRFYLSKNYNGLTNAGNKAKTDIEEILSKLGFKNAGLPQTTYTNKARGFLRTLMGVLKVLFTVSANDIVVVQYPFKKYYSFVCNLIHLKRGKVITIIHDLGTFRRKKLTADKEINRLNHSDVLIVHNDRMEEWLRQQGFTKPMVCLEIFDYLSSSINRKQNTLNQETIKVIYAGALNYKKNSYLYSLKDVMSKWQFELYGRGFEEDKIENKSLFKCKGFVASDQLIEQVSAHFGLIWEGNSIHTCSGDFGVYLKINNPHKVSLYIRCNLPIIIWKEAALASFVAEHKIGICISSLEELDSILPSITLEAYDEMVRNVRNINEKISSGYYCRKAVDTAEKLLMATSSPSPTT